jgi:hypothetical protein
LFELSTAIPESHSGVDIEVILTDAEEASFFEAMEVEGYDAIDRAFDTIRSENAQARQPSDLATIRSLILSRPGGFETLDLTVLSHLDQWFRELGAVKSSNRRRSSTSNRRRSLTRSAPSLAENTPPRRRSCTWDADAAFMGPRDASSTQPRTVLRTVEEQATTLNENYVATGPEVGDGEYMVVSTESDSGFD